MSQDENSFQIEQLDHVAIRVSDLEASAEWYSSILGLQRVQPKEWKPWPIFMVAGKSGVALFPKHSNNDPMPDHFAFRVDDTSFERAQTHLLSRSVDFKFQDHVYFHSIYFKDPDGHTVELTTQVKEF